MRIAITMRTARDAATGEIRDALDRGWWAFLATALPGDTFLPVPNHPASARRFLEETSPDGLLLTGGDDVGTSPERDGTESILLEACIGSRRPVLGVCRGLQFLSSRHGGRILSCDPSLHRAVRHAIRTDPSLAPASAAGLSDANSYHDRRVELPSDGPLSAWAWSADGCVEGVVSRKLRLLGIGWHPEREAVARVEDIALFRTHFHGDAP